MQRPPPPPPGCWRMQGWNVKRVYYARHQKPAMDELGVEFVDDLDKFLGMCDLVTVNVPLTDATRGKDLLSKS